MSYVLSFIGRQAKSIMSAINERSLNLQLYATVEDNVLDLYSAARNGYLQRRRRAIALVTQDREEEWAWARSAPVTEPAPQTASSPRGDNPA
jgi:ABC-type transporter lipoprotein component MlaA